MKKNNEPLFRSTTVLAVHRDGKGAMAADGQVSLGNTIMKPNAKKLRRLYNNQVITGFAGATADAFTLLERFEEKLEMFRGNLFRSSVELAKDWRTDRYLRKLEAMLIAMDAKQMLLISGTGDVIETDEQILAIGSGGNYALSSARALMNHTQMSAKDIAYESLKIAGDICIYTNTNIILEEV